MGRYLEVWGPFIGDMGPYEACIGLDWQYIYILYIIYALYIYIYTLGGPGCLELAPEL